MKTLTKLLALTVALVLLLCSCSKPKITVGSKAPTDIPSVPTTEQQTQSPTDTPTVPTTDTPVVPSTDTPVPSTDTPVPSTDTPVPSTDTPVPSTDTPVPSTDTPVPSTDTPVPSTDTPVPSTDTPVPSTDTPVPSTDTPVPSTDTPVPSTDTPVIPTETPLPPKADYEAFYPEEKLIAFTFDDGPDWWTTYILDTIDGTDDKVSFFITGYMLDESPSYAEYVRRAVSMGCDVGIHGYDHVNVYYESQKKDASESVIAHEIGDLAAKYESVVGKKPQLFRPVGGGYNPTRDYGYPVILWTVDSEDWMTWDKYALDENGKWDRHHKLYDDDPAVKAYYTELAVNEIVNEILGQIRPGDIVLMHDVFDISRQAFAKIYPILKEQGYKLVTVSELLGITPEEHHGNCFFSTYFWGTGGKTVNLDKQKTAAALPPRKED